MRAASRKQQLAKLHKESHPGNAVSTCNKRNEACNRKFVPTKDRANRTLTLGILGLIALLLILFCIMTFSVVYTFENTSGMVQSRLSDEGIANAILSCTTVSPVEKAQKLASAAALRLIRISTFKPGSRPTATLLLGGCALTAASELHDLQATAGWCTMSTLSTAERAMSSAVLVRDVMSMLPQCPHGLNVFVTEKDFEAAKGFFVQCVDATRPLCELRNPVGQVESENAESLSLWVVNDPKRSAASLRAATEVAPAYFSHKYEEAERLRLRKQMGDRVIQRFESAVVCL